MSALLTSSSSLPFSQQQSPHSSSSSRPTSHTPQSSSAAAAPLPTAGSAAVEAAAAEEAVSGSPVVFDDDHRRASSGTHSGEPSRKRSTRSLSATEDADGRLKPKQKRNKPTLSCEECVERKTKCDRGRPSCLACIKRQSECRYTHVANLIANAKENNGTRARYVTKPPSKLRKTKDGGPSSPVIGDAMSRFAPAVGSTAGNLFAQPFLQSNVPLSRPEPSNIFGIGSQHPFSNYWTCQGGLAEVVGVLPSKDQADILVAKYFECVDPVYPFVHKRIFYSTYEQFWALPLHEKLKADADQVALHFTLYALGTQFMQFPAYEERTQSAEFYASAANQALRVYSYLNRTSLRAIACMLLLGYFLMNDNHASDAFAWCGIVLRQAYAMRLHRDPEIVIPHAPAVEKHMRRKFWQAVFFQDTFLTVLLKLPPTATHSDVSLDELQDESTYRCPLSNAYTGNLDRVENLMSINVIAPQGIPTPPLLSHQTVDPLVDKSDVEYLKCMWKLGHLVQENLSSPLSLQLPISNSPRQKTSLISSFRALYRSCPSYLTTLDPQTLQQQALSNPRQVRQNLFLTSNYYHCLMLLQASENPAAGVERNTRGALEAAHEAIWAYIKLYSIFESDSAVWWVFQHRAFEEALTIADLLSEPSQSAAAATAAAAAAAAGGSDAGGGGGGTVSGIATNDALYAKCKDDVARMLELLARSRGSAEMKMTRRAVLQAAFEKMAV